MTGDVGPSVPAPVRGGVALFLGCSSLQALIFCAPTPVLPAIAAYLGGVTAAQLVFTLPGVGVIVAGAFAARCLVRFGQRAVAMAGLVLYVASGTAGLYVEGSAAFLGMRMLVGLAAGLVTAAVFEWVGRNFEDARRARLMGAFSALATAIAVAGTPVAGFTAAASGWRAVFALYACAVPLVFLAYVALDRRPAAARAPERARDLTSMLGVTLRVTCGWIVVFTAVLHFPFKLAALGIDDPARQGAFGAICGVFSVFGSLLYARLTAWTGARRMTVLLLLLLGAGLLGMGASHALAPFVLFAVVTNAGAGMVAPHLSGMLLASAPADRLAGAAALIGTLAYTGQFVAAAITAPIAERVGVDAVLVGMGAVTLLTVLVAARGSTARPPRLLGPS